MNLPVSWNDIERAQNTLSHQVLRTPVLRCDFLSQRLRADVFLKLENTQLTHSFKARGSLNKLLSLSDQEKRRGVVTASAGNHAQSVAFHAQKLGIAATIVMPETTPYTKIRRTQSYGATIKLYGDNLSQSFELAKEWMHDQKLTLVHPYDDPWIIAGQGTVGSEMAQDCPALDVVLVPVGGGGLLSGVAIAFKHLSPQTKIVGVQVESYPHMHCFFHHQPLPVAATAPIATMAEGIAVKQPGQYTKTITRECVDDIVLVSESWIENAVQVLARETKTVVEGAGAAAVAYLLQHCDQWKNKRVGVILSGGNIDTRLLSFVLLRGLAREGRIVKLRILIPDSPGSLSKVTHLIGQAGGNILEIIHNRLPFSVPVKSTEIEVLMETFTHDHVAEILTQLQNHGFKAHKVEQS